MKDILIIGGGIVGAAIAQHLAQYHLDILLLEKEFDFCFGVSKSNSGIIHTGFQSDSNTLKAKLAVRGNQLYTQLAESLHFPYRKIGELVVAYEREEDKLFQLKENGERLNISDMKIVDQAWIREYEPHLSNEITAGLLGRTAGVVNPYETSYALLENARDNGVEMHTEEEVIYLEQRDGFWEIRTTRKQYNARYVINSAGLFADDVSRLAGIECESIFPRKGEEYLLDKHLGNITNRVIFPLPQANTKGTLIIPTIDFNYMIGPTAFEIEDKEDLATSIKGKEDVLAHIKRLVPELVEPDIIASFAGLRPATKSGDFHISLDRPGFINLIGIQSPGLTAAPAIAEMVKELIAQKMLLKKRDNFWGERLPIPRFRELPFEQRNELIAQDPSFGEIVCRCEEVTKGEIKEAIRRGARCLDSIKFHTRCQMGRCHGAFCTMKILAILHEELGKPYATLTKRGKGSEVVLGVRDQG